MPQTSTTHPSASTNQKSAVGRARQVRWVFPEPRLLSLLGRQAVGRDETCALPLPGKEISREHAEFRVDGPVVAVRDLASRNGLFVNGTRCADARLELGDVIRCGEWIGVMVAENPVAEFTRIAKDWYGGAALLGAIDPARRLRRELRVVVQGETGTGKEGMARALHDWSGRKGDFVPVNCAALPDLLAEGELFGYRKGAFTSADRSYDGLIRAADKGTLFLDEILELSPAVQAKLLRTLESNTVRGLGEIHDVPFDVRVICATQSALSDAVAAGRFRADLCARLDHFTVVLPALRERREDIAPLFLQFLGRCANQGPPPEIEAKLIEALCLYQWPANIRELFAVTQQMMATHVHGEPLKKARLPPKVTDRHSAALPAVRERPTPVPAVKQKRQWRTTDDDVQFTSLVAALRAHGGNVAKAAAAIDIGRDRAYRLIAAHPDLSLEALRNHS